MPGRVAAATVDHQLRPESAAEARFVDQLCAEIGVSHTTLKVTVESGNLQQNARRARYRALLDWLPYEGDSLIRGTGRGPSALATAHHADDQLETMLMRLNRGSGLSGLSGIRPYAIFPPHSAPVLRPLLQWRRAELAAIVEGAGIEAVMDPSNSNPDFERVRLRARLADVDWLDAAGFARSARFLQQVETTLDFVIEEEFRDCTEPGEPFAYFPFARGTLHREAIWMGVIEVMARHMDYRLTADQSARIVASLLRPEKTNIAGLQAWSDEVDGQVRWCLAPEPQRRTG